MIPTSDSIGGVNDLVEVKIDGKTLLVCTGYDVKHAFFTSAPNVWAVRVGYSGPPGKLIKLGRPRTKIELYVGGLLQETGWTDGPEVESDSSGGTVVTIHGRDRMAELHDARVLKDTSFKNLSYGDLTQAVLGEALGSYELVISGGNRANRMASTGSTTRSAPVDPAAPDDVKAALTAPQGRTLRAKSSEKWFDFLKHQLDRAGLFLITGAAGEFILCAPNVDQRPMFRIIREAGGTRNRVAVVKAKFKNLATGRSTVYQIHGRGGGGTTASPGVHIPDGVADDIRPALLEAAAAAGGGRRMAGIYVDQEMVDWGYPLTRVWSHKDPKCAGPAQADFLARFHCAHDRRAGWSLIYTVPGHTWPAIGGGERLTWAIDTMVEIVDDEYDIHGNFWIESVDFKRDGNGTSTDLHLMRPGDLVFGEP